MSRGNGYEQRIIRTALLAVVPLAVVAIALAWLGGFDTKTRWTIVAIAAACLFLVTFRMHEHVVYPIRTVASLIGAIREEDYSMRGRFSGGEDVLSEVMAEINSLTAILEDRKLEAIEAAALLRSVLSEIDAAIFTFDDAHVLRLVNRAGERLLDSASERLMGRGAEEIGIGDLLTEGAPEIVDRRFPGVNGRWSVRRSTFREKGRVHLLLVITDVTRALREEQLLAWQKIVRVLGHELNNSLAPIKSIASSIEQLLTREPRAEGWTDDISRGARVIANRSEALTRFMRGYSQLARLPQPRKRPTSLADVVRRASALETRVPVRIASSADVMIDADPDQIEQLTINIVKNAADAALETGGGVSIDWSQSGQLVTLRVVDDGPGLSGSANLFVPFFTTKPEGTGIGLVLSRQIAEAHGGSLTLENRNDGPGAMASLEIPVME
jgi:nitrogen fixation/metabolism regulation signal transduction histidine kinase